MKKIILISGPLAVGKTSLAQELITRHLFGGIRTGPHLLALAAQKGVDQSRRGLQELGDQLDSESNFRWVVEVAQKSMKEKPNISNWLFDSVRKQRQVEHFRNLFGAAVVHIHLTAPEDVLVKRYQSRLGNGSQYFNATPYAEAIKHPNESASRALIAISDRQLDLSVLSANEAALIITQLSGVPNEKSRTD